MKIHIPICHAPNYRREKTVSILDRLFWTVQPPQGLIKGHYYREEMRFGSGGNFDPGHLGILEVVYRDGKLRMVEFNERCTPTYYVNSQQDMSKRLSNYCFFQATKGRTEKTGAVIVNGMTHVEQQMMAENRLTGAFDLVTGASNSINRAMLPLAEKIAAQLDQPSGKLYYGTTMQVEEGVTGRLQVVLEDGRYVSSFYDEIFADRPEEIADPDLKRYYRQSKYYSPEYISTSALGFNKYSDLIGQMVVENQSLTQLPALILDPYPAEMGRYPEIARLLEKEILADGVLRR